MQRGIFELSQYGTNRILGYIVTEMTWDALPCVHYNNLDIDTMIKFIVRLDGVASHTYSDRELRQMSHRGYFT